MTSGNFFGLLDPWNAIQILHRLSMATTTDGNDLATVPRNRTCISHLYHGITTLHYSPVSTLSLPGNSHQLTLTLCLLARTALSSYNFSANC